MAILVKEYDDALQTLNTASSGLMASSDVKVGDKVVAVSGSPLAMSGRTSTIRLLQVAEDGSLTDLG